MIAPMRPVAPVAYWSTDDANRSPYSSRPAPPRVMHALRPLIPPPPRVPAEARDFLAQALAEPMPDGPLDDIFDEIVPATTDPWLPLVSGEEHDRRVRELQENASAALEAARAARRERDRARIEADVWSTRALVFEASLRRLDPIWMGTDTEVTVTLEALF
jgi:hypothetical protein